MPCNEACIWMSMVCLLLLGIICALVSALWSGSATFMFAKGDNMIIHVLQPNGNIWTPSELHLLWNAVSLHLYWLMANKPLWLLVNQFIKLSHSCLPQFLGPAMHYNFVHPIVVPISLAFGSKYWFHIVASILIGFIFWLQFYLYGSIYWYSNSKSPKVIHSSCLWKSGLCFITAGNQIIP